MRVVAIGLMCCSVSIAACAHGALASPPAAPSPPPRIFAPVGWTTTASDLQTAFPRARVETTTYEGEGGITIQDVIATLPGWPLMGFTQVNVIGKPGDPASMLELGTDDPRHECSAESPKRPKNCRNRLGPEVVGVFERVERALRAELGKPEVVRLGQSDDGQAPDREERTLRWVRPGQQIDLALRREEYGTWSVQVTVVRPGAPM